MTTASTRHSAAARRAYTSRGRIITPLKDRFGAQIHTHYPEEASTEIAIMEAEGAVFDDASGADAGVAASGSVPVQSPAFMKEIVAELSQLARRSSEVSQRSGVSVRVTIANHETLAAAALKRAVRLGEPAAAPRISDLPSVVASTAGKIELESLGDETREDRVIEKLVARAVVNVFNRHFASPSCCRWSRASRPRAWRPRWGSSCLPLAMALWWPACPSWRPPSRASTPASRLPASPQRPSSSGLHLNRRLNKERRGGGVRYAR